MRQWMKQCHSSFDSSASVPGGSCMPFAWASKARSTVFFTVTLHPRRLKQQRTVNSLFTWYVWLCTNRVVMPKAPFSTRVKVWKQLFHWGNEWSPLTNQWSATVKQKMMWENFPVLVEKVQSFKERVPDLVWEAVDSAKLRKKYW